MDLAHTPAFATYALFATFLSVFVVLVDAFGGVARTKSKTTLNEEDAKTVAQGAKLVESDPDGVARVMRAHRNALANIVPFLIVGLLYVLLGATPTWIMGLFGVFTFARVIHAFAYINGKQPWRTLSFVIGQACLTVAAVQVVRAAIALV